MDREYVMKVGISKRTQIQNNYLYTVCLLSDSYSYICTSQHCCIQDTHTVLETLLFRVFETSSGDTHAFMFRIAMAV